MILYLASNQHRNLLDFLCQDEESNVPVKKMVGNFILKQFIIHDMRNFSHCTELVLDRIAFGDYDKEFAEAIKEFLTMYNARTTVIAEGLSEKDELFAELLNAGVGNIVTEPEIRVMQQEIRQSLSGQGMTKYHPKERENSRGNGVHYQFSCERLNIAVISSQPRMGATTLALGLANWIRSVGGQVCYVEGNESGCLQFLITDYEMEPKDMGFVSEGVGYYRNVLEKEYQFIITDYGAESRKMQADLILLVCGIKPYEKAATMRILNLYKTEDVVILLPFVDDDLQDNYAKFFRSYFCKVLFLNYQPDCFNGEPNADQYRAIVEDYILYVTS